MNFYDSNCCAIQELGGLSAYITPEQALKAFISRTLPKDDPKFRVKYRSIPATPNTIYSFYLFTAAVTDKGEGLWGSKPYGKAFADLIEKEGLGQVLASPLVKNLAYHKDHSNQVWIWTPDREALLRWRDKNEEPKPVLNKTSIPKETKNAKNA